MVRIEATTVAPVSHFQPTGPLLPLVRDIMTETVIEVVTCVCSYGLGLHGNNKVLILTARLKMTKVESVSRFPPTAPFSPSVLSLMTGTVAIAGTCVCTSGLGQHGNNKVLISTARIQATEVE